MNLAIWTITLATLAGVILRPLKLPEAIWAVAGAGLTLALRLLSPAAAFAAVMKGSDVYLFLTGMMLLSEVARREGLFDWVAVHAVRAARGSSTRLFLLVYALGVAVTVFLSNDATAVVLTPAVFAAAKKARTHARPLLLVCALVANAASFVLPISNPANIVLYGDHTPPLAQWLARFALPSLLSIAATCAVLWFTQRNALRAACATQINTTALSGGGRLALASLALAAIVLMSVSALDRPLGLPTAVLGAIVATVVLLRRRESPLPLLRAISWSVLPLVAGLFVLVEAISGLGVAAELAEALNQLTAYWPQAGAAAAASLLAVGCSLVNNLPAGLLASSAIAQAPLPQSLVDALLIGVDVGPNLSITGSLATILWLNAIRREGEDISFAAFLRIGVVTMPPALLLALAARLLL